MEALIKITDYDGRQAVSARELHKFIESKQDFSTWIKARIEKYGLVENQDFEVFHKVVDNLQGGRPQIEYALTVDAAKELSMVEGNERGKMARQYFIECERRWKDAEKALSPSEILLRQCEMLVEQERRLKQLETNQVNIGERISELEAKQEIPADYYTVAGYASLVGVRLPLEEAKRIGKNASYVCKRNNYPIGKCRDSRYGSVNTYPKDVLCSLIME